MIDISQGTHFLTGYNNNINAVITLNENINEGIIIEIDSIRYFAFTKNVGHYLKGFIYEVSDEISDELGADVLSTLQSYVIVKIKNCPINVNFVDRESVSPLTDRRALTITNLENGQNILTVGNYINAINDEVCPQTLYEVNIENIIDYSSNSRHMTDSEILNIVSYHESGCEVEQCLIGSDSWAPFDGPWNFSMFTYRPKPKKDVVPYKSIDEFFKDQKIHGYYIKLASNFASMPINVYEEDGDLFVEFRDSDDLDYIGTKLSFEELADELCWVDGAPCGYVKSNELIGIVFNGENKGNIIYEQDIK